MGICCSSPEDPLVRQFQLASTYGEKAEIVLKIAARSERLKNPKEAIVHYGTYLHCAAVHLYKEDPRKNRDMVLNKINMGRRIMTYRNTLERGIQRKEKKYVAPLISAPSQLSPWEWQEWLAMVRSASVSIDTLMERFGLVRLVSADSKKMALAAAMASSTNVSVNPNINITGPTINNSAQGGNSNSHGGNSHGGSSQSNPSIAINTGASAQQHQPQPQNGVTMQSQQSQPMQMQQQYSQPMQQQFSQPMMQPMQMQQPQQMMQPQQMVYQQQQMNQPQNMQHQQPNVAAGFPTMPPPPAGYPAPHYPQPAYNAQPEGYPPK